MMNLFMCLLFIVFGVFFGLIGVLFIAQFRERVSTETLTRGTFRRFYVYFGKYLGIGDIIIGLFAFALSIACWFV